MKKEMMRYILGGVLLTCLGVATANTAVNSGCMALKNTVWVTTAQFVNSNGQTPVYVDVSVKINDVKENAGDYVLSGSINNQSMTKGSCVQFLNNNMISAAFFAGTMNKFSIVVQGTAHPEALTSPRNSFIWQTNNHFYFNNDNIVFLPR